MTVRTGPDDDSPEYQVAATQTDLATAQSASLGFSPLDGRGRPFFVDTFREGLAAWQIQLAPSIAPIVIADPSSGIGTVGPTAYVAPNVVKFPMPGAGTQISQIVRQQYLGVSRRLGFEVAFFIGGGVTPNTLIVTRLYYKVVGTSTGYGAELRYNPSTDVWSVLTPSGPFTLATLAIRGGWVEAKIVADFSTGLYIRAVVGETSFDLSTQQIAASSVTDGLVSAQFFDWPQVASAHDLYCGYAIITRDEP